MARDYWDNRVDRRLPRRRVLGILGGAGLIAATTACTTSAGTPTVVPTAGAAGASTAAPVLASPTAAARPPKRGGTFRWGTSTTYDHLDPHQTTNSMAFGFGLGLCWSRLLKFKLQGVQLPAFLPAGDLAESWEQPDDVTYIFKLRRNVKFQNLAPVNGRAFTAEDVLFSFNRQRSQGFANASVLQAVTKIEAPDPYTVKITADQPAADFLLALAAPQSVIVAKEVVQQKGDLKEGPMIGTGAFIVDKTDRAGPSTAKRNPDYFVPGQPYVDAYEIYIIADVLGQVSAFRSNNIDVIPHASPNPEQAESAQKSVPGSRIELVKGLGSGTELALKLDRRPFDYVRVRRAVYKAIDAQTIINTAYGSGWLSVGLPLPGIDWALPADEMGRLLKRDLDGAKRLLAEAGFANGFDMNLTVFNASFFPIAAELVAAQLAEANIRAKLELVDGATFSARVRGRGEFEASLGSSPQYSSADSALFSRYHSKGSNNVFTVKDAQLDQMIEKQTTLGRNPDERKKLLFDIQRRILDQAYVNYFHTFESPTVLQPYVRDFFPGFGALNLEGDKWALTWLDK